MLLVWARLVGLLATGQVHDPQPWVGLEPGPFAAGYRSYYLLDAKRRYGPDRARRPILVVLWYPAAAGAGKPLQYREYLAPPVLPGDAEFSSKLERFLLDTVSDDLFQKKRAALG